MTVGGHHSAKPWFSEVPRDTRWPIRAGILLCCLFVLGFGLWGATAPISGAIVAPGAFVATGQNKLVQNLDGGVIAEIAVREGDVVKRGQLLIRLDELGPKAELRRLQLRLVRLTAVEARLVAEAERRSAPDLDGPGFIKASLDEDQGSVIAIQKLAFVARRRALDSELAGLKESISSLEEHLRGTEVQKAAAVRGMALFQEEIAAKAQLLAGGMLRRSEMLALQRAEANMEGEVGRLTGEIGDTRGRMARAREQMASTINAAVKSAVEELQEVRADLYDTRERTRTAEGALRRVRVLAPVNGVVIKLGYHTTGGVVEPGKAIMEILPLDDELLVEARIRPQDIDHVRNGAAAAVRLNALDARVTPLVNASVVYVSADALQEDARLDRSGGSYLVRVKLDRRDVGRLAHFVAQPGMPAEVYVKTGDRTFLGYILRPIRDSMSRAFRES